MRRREVMGRRGKISATFCATRRLFKEIIFLPSNALMTQLLRASLFRFSFRSLSSTTKPNGTELHSSSRRALCAGLKVVSNDSIARAP